MGKKNPAKERRGNCSPPRGANVRERMYAEHLTSWQEHSKILMRVSILILKEPTERSCPRPHTQKISL